MDNIDYETIIELVKKNKGINFHFIGPNSSSNKNNNLGVQKDNKKILEFSKSRKIQFSMEYYIKKN